MTIVPTNALYFRQASAQEKIACWRRNSASWSGVLKDMTDYLGREKVNGDANVTRNGQIKYWVLSSLEVAPGDDEQVDESTILAACETLSRPVLVRTKNDAQATEETSYGIASVFTDPNNRGKGAATLLLKGLVAWLDSKEANCRFSALYSDIGKEFYAERGGWNPYSSEQITITLDPKNTISLRERSTLVDVLDKAGVESVCVADIAVLKQEYNTRQLADGTGALVTFLPTYAQACWHFGTEEYVGKIAQGRSPYNKGAKINNIALYWVHDFTEKKLVILRFAVTIYGTQILVDDVKELLLEAEREALQWGFGRIVAWSPVEQLIQAANGLEGRGVIVGAREKDSIPSLRWKKGVVVDGVTEWWPSEKYAWC